MRTPRAKKAEAPTEAAAAVWMPIAKLKPWKKNPRNNDGRPVDTVAESIKRFGWGAVIVARGNGTVVAGHTRLKAVALLKEQAATTTAADFKKWHPDALRSVQEDVVPVRLGEWSPKDAEKLALVDNRSNELAKWDGDGLSGLMKGYSDSEVALLGWTPEEAAKLHKDAEAFFPPGDEGDQGALDVKTKTVCPKCQHEF